MKHPALSRVFTLLMVFCMLATLAVPAVFAAEVTDATVQMDKLCSLTIYKYDYTNAAKDGAWNKDSYVSTGQYDPAVNGVLGDTNIESILGNEELSKGYAIKGVEYSYLKVADFYQYSDTVIDGDRAVSHTELLYKFDKELAADLLKAIGLENGKDSSAAANALHEGYWCYQSDVLNKALASALNSNATTVKNALEAYIKANGGTAMDETDANGYTIAEDLPVGLYLLVETKVPEMVTNTTNPFFVSLPMTSVNGGINNSHVTTGGHDWLYDVTIYPKNETGIVTLEKTVREAKKDFGTHNGSVSDIKDGFKHYATASAGDTVEYQIISTLPTITSAATALSDYTFQDTLARGLAYDTETPVKIEWFKDAACTELVTTWTVESGKFIVNPAKLDDGVQTMTITMSAAGLAEINGSNNPAANSNGSVYAGYSNYTMRITYAAVLNSDESLIYGDAGNCNEVALIWSRSSEGYKDVLIDDAHVYTYGINLTKKFSDKKNDQALFDHVLFKVQNATDGYFVTAELDASEGIWYVTGFTANEADATAFNPVECNGKAGQIVIKGLEDDKYILTEVETANGYILLKEDIIVEIKAEDDASRPCDVYAGDLLGVIQNDIRYSYDGGLDLRLANITQAALAHNHLTASATVNGKDVVMLADDMDTDSTNALAPLSVINSRGFDLPQTGDAGFFWLPIVGAIGCISALCLVFLFATKTKKKENN